MSFNRFQIQSLHSALLSAFPSSASLERMVRFKLGENLTSIVDGDNQSDRIFKLIQWAEARGKVVTLIIGAYQENPENLEIQSLSQLFPDIFSDRLNLNQSENVSDVLDLWTEAALQSALWNKKDGEVSSSQSDFENRVKEIVSACWQLWQTAEISFPQDMWRDEELPIRVLESLELLIFRSNPPIKLSDAETVNAIVVPFLREAILASGMIHAAKVNALSLKKCEIEHTLRDALDKHHQTQSRFARKAQLLQEQGLSNDKDTVMTWMVYQCLLKSLETWQPEASGGYIADSFIRAIENTECCNSRLVNEALSRRRLLELAYCMYSDFERIDRDDRPDALQIAVSVGSYREEQLIREKLLAYLLKLAGMLSIDIRILSEVLVDHVGLADPLTPKQIRNTIAQVRWVPSGLGRVLSVECNHPAVDLALREHTEQSEIVLSHILRQADDNRARMEVLSGLPSHLRPDHIKAVKRDGEPVYQTPHVNFRLAHDEIRELLMGEQLYGDPMLAIRELYQNALDACRYRRARLRYLKQTRQCNKDTYETWEGQIVFRQMVDEFGRAYIECTDNGIGMALQHLEGCFARAGRRFAEMPEYIEEHAEWQKCEPPILLFPNSQFGVGVLSYFMLADEIEIETCRLDRDGQPGERLQIRIPGNSGLFRVQRLGQGHEAGTRVRLYLNRTRHEGQLISCVETLRKLLWIAEFHTEAHHFGRREFWSPGKLKHPDYPEEYCLDIDGTDIWWVPQTYYHQKTGCVLSDGVWTSKLKSGFVINLHGRFLPKLTVDRKDIISYEQSWATQQLIQNAEPVLNWNGLDLQLLWNLSKGNPILTEHIVAGLKSNMALIPLNSSGMENFEVPIHKTDCFEPDSSIIQSRYGISIPTLVRIMPYWLVPYRLLVWQEVGLYNFFEECLDSIPPLMKPEFWPKLEAGDHIILQESFPSEGINLGLNVLVGRVPPANIALAAMELGEPLSMTLNRFQKFAHIGLELPEIDIQGIHHINITDEDIIALSISINEDLGVRGGEHLRYPWPEERISVGQIVLTSMRLDESIDESIHRFQKFSPVGLKVVNMPTENFTPFDITPEDVISLSSQLDGERARKRNRISPIDIESTARRLNESVVTTIKRFQKFLPFGLKLPQLDIDSLSDYKIEHDVVAQRIIERELKDVVSVAQIVKIAGQLNEQISDTMLRLEKFVPLGLQLLDVDRSETQGICIDREDLTIFSERNHPKSSWKYNQVTPAHLIKAAVNLNESIEDALSRFQKFTPLGLEIPQFDSKLLTELVNSNDDLIAMSTKLTTEFAHPYDLHRGTIEPIQIILASLALKESLWDTHARFQRFAPALGLTLPKGKPSSWQFQS